MHEEDKSKGSTFPHWILQLNSRLNIQSNWRKKNPLHQENYTLRSCFSDYNQMFKKNKKRCPEIVYNYFCLKKERQKLVRETYVFVNLFLKKMYFKI